MSCISTSIRVRAFGLGLVLAISVPMTTAVAGSFQTLLSFDGAAGGKYPDGGLVRDKLGNLYGSTVEGGDPILSYGVAYQLSTTGTETVLHTFEGEAKNDGNYPLGDLVRDRKGNLYGATAEGGTHGAGAVFKLTTAGKEKLLHSFDGTESGDPMAGLVRDGSGNLYGTAGTVFEIAADGTYSTLYSFNGANDGYDPSSVLVFDGNGNLVGTTRAGGSGQFNGCGTVFAITPAGLETFVYDFPGNQESGCEPYAGVILDASGNIYGTTIAGGTAAWGTVFKIAPDGTETVLHSFTSGNDGAEPEGALLLDTSGNLYGTTSVGGSTNCAGQGCGTVFKIAPGGTETILHAFNGTDGKFPSGTLIADKHGYLYGTTSGGGANSAGTVFKLKK